MKRMHTCSLVSCCAACRMHMRAVAVLSLLALKVYLLSLQHASICPLPTHCHARHAPLSSLTTSHFMLRSAPLATTVVVASADALVRPGGAQQAASPTAADVLAAHVAFLLWVDALRVLQGRHLIAEATEADAAAAAAVATAEAGLMLRAVDAGGIERAWRRGGEPPVCPAALSEHWSH